MWVTANTKLRDLLFKWSRGKCKALYLSFCNTYGHQNWQSDNLQWGNPTLKVGRPHILSQVTFLSRGHVTNWKHYFCTFTITMATKLGRVATYGWKTPHTKSHYLLITWSRQKRKTLYLPFSNIYGHQIWKSGNLPWRVPTFRVMWPFAYVVTWQMKKTYIWTFAIPMTTKLGRMVTYIGVNPPSNSHDLLITWSRDKGKT